MNFLSVRIRPFSPAGRRRVVIAVSAKVVKKATVRNLLKRRIRAILQPILKSSKLGFFVTVRTGAANLSFQELKKELLKHVPTI